VCVCLSCLLAIVVCLAHVNSFAKKPLPPRFCHTLRSCSMRHCLKLFVWSEFASRPASGEFFSLFGQESVAAAAAVRTSGPRDFSSSYRISEQFFSTGGVWARALFVISTKAMLWIVLQLKLECLRLLLLLLFHGGLIRSTPCCPKKGSCSYIHSFIWKGLTREACIVRFLDNKSKQINATTNGVKGGVKVAHAVTPLKPGILNFLVSCESRRTLEKRPSLNPWLPLKRLHDMTACHG